MVLPPADDANQSFLNKENEFLLRSLRPAIDKSCLALPDDKAARKREMPMMKKGRRWSVGTMGRMLKGMRGDLGGMES